jgi:hypothetical protein
VAGHYCSHPHEHSLFSERALHSSLESVLIFCFFGWFRDEHFGFNLRQAPWLCSAVEHATGIVATLPDRQATSAAQLLSCLL